MVSIKRIAICDDEKICGDEIESVIESFIAGTEYDIGYEMFACCYVDRSSFLFEADKARLFFTVSIKLKYE